MCDVTASFGRFSAGGVPRVVFDVIVAGSSKTLKQTDPSHLFFDHHVGYLSIRLYYLIVTAAHWDLYQMVYIKLTKIVFLIYNYIKWLEASRYTIMRSLRSCKVVFKNGLWLFILPTLSILYSFENVSTTQKAVAFVWPWQHATRPTCSRITKTCWASTALRLQTTSRSRTASSVRLSSILSYPVLSSFSESWHYLCSPGTPPRSIECQKVEQLFSTSRWKSR